MVCFRFEPSTAGWQAQTNPLRSDWLLSTVKLSLHSALIKFDCILTCIYGVRGSGEKFRPREAGHRTYLRLTKSLALCCDKNLTIIKWTIYHLRRYEPSSTYFRSKEIHGFNYVILSSFNIYYAARYFSRLNLRAEPRGALTIWYRRSCRLVQLNLCTEQRTLNRWGNYHCTSGVQFYWFGFNWFTAHK